MLKAFKIGSSVYSLLCFKQQPIAFWSFFALIFVHVIAALAQFVRMVLLPAHDLNDR